ncbi:MAG: hypothetical protein HQL92_05845 [Magnetococcales bacterium]|nr:hypothetical protein [Magnetococcales bacterium]
MGLQSDPPGTHSEPTCEELTKLFMNGQLATEMAHRFNLNNPDALRKIQVCCAGLHNNGTLDLLQLIESSAMQRLAGSDFFMAMHFFCDILPELEATPERMMTCIEALVTRGGEDLAANQPNGAFRSWCQKDPNRARKVILAAHNGDELASRHVAFALEAIADIAEARKMAITYNDARRLAAITALGRIHDLDPASCAETLAAFSTLLAGGADDKLRANMLRSITEILTRNPVFASPDAVALVHRLVENGGDFTIHECSHMLWASRQTLSPDIVTGLLKKLIHLNPANKGTVNELDIGLQSLLEHGHEEAAISFVTELLALPDGSLELQEFDSFIRTLLDGPPERLGRIVVQWLLLGIPHLCKGLAEILQSDDMVGPPIHLSADQLDISPTAQLFLCRKAIGWFFLKPTTATSILVSVLRVCDAETAKEVQALLVEHLLLNYHGVREHLEALPSDDLAKSRVDQALEQHNIHFNAVRAIPPIKELQPSEHYRRIQQLHWSDQMRDAYNQPKNQSVLMSIVKRSVLLYGNSCRTFVKDSMTNMPRPVDIELHQLGVSFAVPRMEIIDPAGLQWILFNYKHEKLTS